MTSIPDTPPTAPSTRIYRRRPGEPVVHVYRADGFARCGAGSPSWRPVNPERVHPDEICRECSLAECLRQTGLAWGPETLGYAPGLLAERWLNRRATLRVVADAPVPLWRRLIQRLRGGW